MEIGSTGVLELATVNTLRRELMEEAIIPRREQVWYSVTELSHYLQLCSAGCDKQDKQVVLDSFAEKPNGLASTRTASHQQSMTTRTKFIRACRV